MSGKPKNSAVTGTKPQAKAKAPQQSKSLEWQPIQVDVRLNKKLFSSEGDAERFISLETIDGSAIYDPTLLGSKRSLELSSSKAPTKVSKQILSEKESILKVGRMGPDGFIYFDSDKQQREVMAKLKELNEKADAEAAARKRRKLGITNDDAAAEVPEHADSEESESDLDEDSLVIDDAEEDIDEDGFGFMGEEDGLLDYELDEDEDMEEDAGHGGVDFEGLVDFDAVNSLEELEELDRQRAQEAAEQAATAEEDDEQMYMYGEEDEDEDGFMFDDEDDEQLEFEDEPLEEFKVSDEHIPETLRELASTMEVGRKDEEFLAWAPLGLHPLLMQGIKRLGFTQPTPIQEECIIPAAKGWKDVVGAAQTGSGKTLAFGLPILEAVIENRERVAEKARIAAEEARRKELLQRAKESGEKIKRSVLEAEIAAAGTKAYAEANGPKSDLLTAIILTPTRELAAQIGSHLDQVAKDANIRSLVVVGGLAVEKQRRILTKNNPPIIVATPGRLWELISEGIDALMDLSRLRFFVLDEADRMVANGSFPELDNIIKYVQSFREDLKELTPQQRIERNIPKRMQVFLFSATLTLKDEGHHKRQNRYLKLKDKYKKRKQVEDSAEDEEVKAQGKSLLVELALRLPFEGKPHIVDLSSKLLITSTIKQEYVQALDEERDDILYYLLHNHTGRALVFVNAVSIVKRISAILNALGIRARPLHAHLQQRQRLKILDQFKSEPRSVIVCTDVAARGLDIPNVQLVIHFHFPQTPEIYVHRTGRTGRAGATGRSVLVVGPKETDEYENLLKVLGPSFQSSLSLHRPDSHVMKMVHTRVSLAQKIAAIEDRSSKVRAESNWLKKMASAAGLDAEDADMPDDDEYMALARSKKKNRERWLAESFGGSDDNQHSEDDTDDDERDEEVEAIKFRKALVKSKELDRLKQELAQLLKKPIKSKMSRFDRQRVVQ